MEKNLISIFNTFSNEKRLDLGPELVTNGDFSVGGFWNLGVNWSIGGGTLNEAAVLGTFSWQNIAIQFNELFLTVFEVSGYVGGRVSIGIGGASVVWVAGNGRFVRNVRQTGGGLQAFLYSDILTTLSIDNVSIRKILESNE